MVVPSDLGAFVVWPNVCKESYAENGQDDILHVLLHYVCICSQYIFVILCFVSALQSLGLLNIVQCCHYCDYELGNDRME